MNLLEQAAEILEREGWGTGVVSGNRHGGPHCLLGALRAVRGPWAEWAHFEPGEETEAFLALRAETLDRFGRQGHEGHLAPADVWMPNDNDVKDQYEAIDILKHAAKRL